MVTFSLQADVADVESWTGLARRCEDIGLDALLVPDHPGVAASPFVALAAAASVTSVIGLGSYVSNAGIREPIHLASDLATLDVLSGGRARFGLGAGHTPAEWEAIGRTRPAPGDRVRRCVAVAEAVLALLEGEEVDVATPDLVARSARLDRPRPVQARIPLTIGGSNARLLRWAGAHADTVSLTGFGRTLGDGHDHAVRWRPHEMRAQLDSVTEGAAGRAAPPSLEALVQRFEITDDAGRAVAELARHLEMTEAEVLAAPFVLVGTEEEIVSAVKDHERRWGITRYVVRPNALDDLATIMPKTRAPRSAP
ncbi:LLM class flavin-dependent oxidoreductase [Nonomuraea phyllanthi]|uniref:LLM class flavin-dependent oxidoreductase n=1 Tax=Nonomuraea phyllanthi TaxID=2219224 RepID=UPI0012934488|nr:LLM class flavin-dependent oxidoreductase [Nonomuraea phyllanthi]QFY07447.1 LLM class flavin-dependent oxidoreductase [Nonomuraea phyllanthi]